MKKTKLLLGSILLATSIQAENLTFEFYSGVVHNMKEDILIRQDAPYDDVEMNNATLNTNPTTNPLYYGMRITKWDGEESAWEFEHVHQKLYISDSDLPAEVQNWEITDGFNFFMMNKAYRDSDLGLIYRYGGGLVITHPDVTFADGRSNHKQGNGAITAGEGYHLSGFVVQTSVQKIFPINKKWYFETELRATYAKANVPVADGDMNVKNRALHLNYGVGYKF